METILQNDFILELLNHSDCPATVALVNHVYRGVDAENAWTSEARLIQGARIDIEGLTDILSDPNQVLLGIKDQSRNLIACVLLQRQDDGAAYLSMLTVALTYQSCGLGAKLLNMTERWALHEWQINRIWMRVINRRKELIAWYERRGYHHTGKWSPFPYHDSRSGIPNYQDLVFEHLEKMVGDV
jgi:GNAT superfamily N-acetyltransferase